MLGVDVCSFLKKNPFRSPTNSFIFGGVAGTLTNASPPVFHLRIPWDTPTVWSSASTDHRKLYTDWLGKSNLLKMYIITVISHAKNGTLQGINISHLGKRKIIFKMPFLGDMLVPWRVIIQQSMLQVRLDSFWWEMNPQKKGRNTNDLNKICSFSWHTVLKPRWYQMIMERWLRGVYV